MRYLVFALAALSLSSCSPKNDVRRHDRLVNHFEVDSIQKYLQKRKENVGIVDSVSIEQIDSMTLMEKYITILYVVDQIKEAIPMKYESKKEIFKAAGAFEAIDSFERTKLKLLSEAKQFRDSIFQLIPSADSVRTIAYDLRVTYNLVLDGKRVREEARLILDLDNRPFYRHAFLGIPDFSFPFER
jgi:hypothetical protein